MPETSAGKRDALSAVAARRLAWLVAIVWLAMRLPWMGRSIWFDEWLRTRQWLSGETAVQAILHDVHNPLYNAFMYAWIRLFGDSPESIRTPGLLVGALSTYALGRWAWRLVSPGAALAACAIIAVSPMHVRASVEAKNVAFVVALCTFTAIAAARLEERPGLRRAAILALLGALAMYASFLALLTLVPLGVWLVISALRRADRASFRATAAAAALTLALAAPVLIFKSAHADELSRNYLEPLKATQLWIFVTVWLTGLVGAVPEFRYQWGLSLLVALALAVPVVRGWRALARARSGGAMLAALVGPVVLCLLVSAVQVWRFDHQPAQHIYQPRNLAMVLPLFALLLGAGLMAIPKGPVRRGLGPVLVAIGAAGTLAMFTANRYRATTGPAVPPWPRLVEIMREDSRGEPRVLFARQSAFASRYYDPELQFVETAYRPLAPAEILRFARERGLRHVYVFDHLEWGDRLGPDYYRALGTRLRLQPLFDRGVIRLWKVGAAAPPRSAPEP